VHVADSSVGSHVVVNEKECVNYGCTGFLELQMHPRGLRLRLNVLICRVLEVVDLEDFMVVLIRIWNSKKL